MSAPWVDIFEAPLASGEVVCEVCRLAFNGHLSACPSCELWTPKEVPDPHPDVDEVLDP